MIYSLVPKEVENNNDEPGRYINIVYNGKIYGEWDDEAHTWYPEDLTLNRDLSELIDIGIEIGKQIEKDKANK